MRCKKTNFQGLETNNLPHKSDPCKTREQFLIETAVKISPARFDLNPTWQKCNTITGDLSAEQNKYQLKLLLWQRIFQASEDETKHVLNCYAKQGHAKQNQSYFIRMHICKQGSTEPKLEILCEIQTAKPVTEWGVHRYTGWSFSKCHATPIIDLGCSAPDQLWRVWGKQTKSQTCGLQLCNGLLHQRRRRLPHERHPLEGVLWWRVTPALHLPLQQIHHCTNAGTRYCFDCSAYFE